MIRKITITLLAILFFIAACSKKEGHTNHGNKKAKVKKALYVGPMHPNITSDKPGKCPICGMDLVLAEDDEEEETEAEHQHDGGKGQGHYSSPPDRTKIKLSLDKTQVIGVKFETVKVRNLFKTIRAPGRVAFDPALYTAQSEYMEALIQRKKVKDTPLQEVKRSTKEMVRAAKIKLKVLGLTDEQINNIGKKDSIYKGLIVGDNLENLIYADLFEAEISEIKKGQKVVVTASFLTGKKLSGEVVSVDKIIDPKTRTGRVRIKIEKTDVSIRPEAFVSVAIKIPLGEHVAVPRDSVFDTGRELFVFVKKKKGRFEPRVILKLYETDEYMAIASGVEAGEEVVTSGTYMLDSESRLKAVIKGNGASSGHNH